MWRLPCGRRWGTSHVQAKINRGAFPAWFLLAALRALGASTLRLE
ncbi:DUF6471 domain-containing protein [Phenylobacterium sp.]